MAGHLAEDPDEVADGWTVAGPRGAREGRRRRRRGRRHPRPCWRPRGRGEDGPGARPHGSAWCTIRPPPTRSSPGSACSASAPASTTTTWTVFNRPNVTLADTGRPRRRAPHRARRRGGRAVNTRTGLPGLRHRVRGRRRTSPRRAPASTMTRRRRRVADAEVGRRPVHPARHAQPAAFPTASSSARRSRACRRTFPTCSASRPSTSPTSSATVVPSRRPHGGGVGPAAEHAWVQTIVTMGEGRIRQFLEACTPGYYNGEGRGSRSDAARQTLALRPRPGRSSSTLLRHLARAGRFRRPRTRW